MDMLPDVSYTEAVPTARFLCYSILARFTVRARHLRGRFHLDAVLLGPHWLRAGMGFPLYLRLTGAERRLARAGWLLHAHTLSSGPLSQLR